MKRSNLFLSMLSLIAFVGLAFTGPTVVESYKVDAESSVVSWTAWKVTGEHSGTVNVKEGSLEFADGQLTGGNFVLDMTSINNTDMEGGMKAKLEGHLKSPDFFNVKEHPTSSFTITKVVSRGKAGEYKISGDLTIKGITKPIKFNTMIEQDKKSATANAKITVDRSEFDVRYGSGSFFDNLGDKTIYDEFELEVKLNASL